MTWFRRVNDLYRRGEETHRLRLYPATDVAVALRRIGFHVRRLAGYGELKFRKGHTGFLARNP
ncbi:MAG TPA: hypothetical protein VFA18_21205 [Gemmataceae bacterium]|nr:hypothetical protein [Gemmataceae bacterium]